MASNWELASSKPRGWKPPLSDSQGEDVFLAGLAGDIGVGGAAAEAVFFIGEKDGAGGCGGV